MNNSMPTNLINSLLTNLIWNGPVPWKPQTTKTHTRKNNHLNRPIVNKEIESIINNITRPFLFLKWNPDIKKFVYKISDNPKALWGSKRQLVISMHRL